MKLKLSLLSVSLIALMSTGNIFGMEFSSDESYKRGEISESSEKSASVGNNFDFADGNYNYDEEYQQAYGNNRNIRTNDSILNTKININKGQNDKRNSYNSYSIEDSSASFNPHDSSNEKRTVRNIGLKNNSKQNKIDKAVSRVKEENGQSTDILLENINKKISANARVKADDVCRSRNIDIIIDDGELCNYWAYDAIKNPKSKFYSSMQNLKTIILKGVRLSDSDYEIFLGSIARNIGKHLFPENVTKSVDSDVVLSLYNGFLCSHAVRNCITREQHGKQINPSEMYIEALQALDSLYVGLGYDADTIHQLIEGIIKDRTSNASASYNNYFKHDFDCYLNQFWVLTDGETADGDKVKSVVSALVTVDSPTHKIERQIFRDKHEITNQITEEEKTINEGRNVLDTLELKIGCKLKDLVDNPDLAELESVLSKAENSCPVPDNYYDPHKTLRSLSDVEKMIQLETEARLDTWTRYYMNYQKVKCLYGFEYYDSFDNEKTNEVSVKEKEIRQTVTEEVWQKYSEERTENMLTEWKDKNAYREDLDMDGYTAYFDKNGINVTDAYYNQLDRIEEELKEQRIELGKLLKETLEIISIENDSKLLNKWLQKNPKYSFDIWRIFQVVCTLYGFDNNGSMDDSNKSSEVFWRLYSKDSRGSQTLNLLKKLWEKYPTVFEVVCRIFVLAENGELKSILENASAVINGDSSVETPAYNYGLLTRRYFFLSSRSDPVKTLVEKYVKRLSTRVEKLKKAGVVCTFPKQINAVFEAVLGQEDQNGETRLEREGKVGNNVNRDDFENDVCYSCPLLTAAISAYIRSFSYYYAHLNECFTNLDEAYTAYRKYCDSKKQLPELVSTFLKEEAKGVDVYKIFSQERFENICNKDTNTYQKQCEILIEKLKNIKTRYEKKCEENKVETTINLFKKKMKPN